MKKQYKFKKIVEYDTNFFDGFHVMFLIIGCLFLIVVTLSLWTVFLFPCATPDEFGMKLVTWTGFGLVLLWFFISVCLTTRNVMYVEV